MKRIASILTVSAVAFALGWWSGRRTPEPLEEVVHIDTVYYARPQLAGVTSRPVTVQVPRVIFARAPPEFCKSSMVALAHTTAAASNAGCCPSTDCGAECANPALGPGNCPPDSLRVTVALETRVYEDSLYRAQVSGPALGELRPALDWVEVCGRTVVRTEPRPFRWEVGPAAGAWYCPAGSGVWLGAEVRRNVGRLSVGAAGGYDPRNAGPFVELRASLALWRR